jgi:phosphoribosyl-ATP pyrophosphohydrolase/phosphoribosyl-AMP cyclohydrolase
MLAELETIIRDRQANPKVGSYTNSLFDKGLNNIAQKVGEEATEVIVAALGQGREQQIGEFWALGWRMSKLSWNAVIVHLSRGHRVESRAHSGIRTNRCG